MGCCTPSNLANPDMVKLIVFFFKCLCVDVSLDGSPSQTELKLILQGFLTRLCVLEGQLTALDPEGACHPPLPSLDTPYQ